MRKKRKTKRRAKIKDIFCIFGEIYFAEMNKTEVEIYRDILGDVSANFDSAEAFTKQKIEEICDQNNISVEEVIYFFCL